VRIFGEEVPLRARVEVINGYSAHADREGLLGWVKPIAQGLERAFAVHGDPGPATALAGELRRLGVRQVTVPEQGTVWRAPDDAKESG
jgi:metallo-beta-lactamase family protein